jgi:hypothetical protein
MRRARRKADVWITGAIMARNADFRELERRNRRETVVLVAVVLLLFCALGFGLDFVIGDVRLLEGVSQDFRSSRLLP